jgi:hypothetical protein
VGGGRFAPPPPSLQPAGDDVDEAGVRPVDDSARLGLLLFAFAVAGSADARLLPLLLVELGLGLGLALALALALTLTLCGGTLPASTAVTILVSGDDGGAFPEAAIALTTFPEAEIALTTLFSLLLPDGGTGVAGEGDVFASGEPVPPLPLPPLPVLLLLMDLEGVRLLGVLVGVG